MFLYNKNKKTYNLESNKKNKHLLIAVFVCIMLSSFFVIPSTARYITIANGNNSSAIVAKPIFEVEFGSTQLSFSDNESGYFCFKVTNSKGTAISETSMRYKIVLSAPTNNLSAKPSVLYLATDATYETRAELIQEPTLTTDGNNNSYSYQIDSMSFGIGGFQEAYYVVKFDQLKSGNVQFKIEIIAEQID